MVPALIDYMPIDQLVGYRSVYNDRHMLIAVYRIDKYRSAIPIINISIGYVIVCKD